MTAPFLGRILALTATERAQGKESIIPGTHITMRRTETDDEIVNRQQKPKAVPDILRSVVGKMNVEKQLRQQQELAARTAPVSAEQRRANLTRQIKETGPQFARGLAESGYATALGVSELAGSLPVIPSIPLLNMINQLGDASPVIRAAREDMREFYGEPETGVGQASQVAGELIGTAAQFIAPGAVAAKLGYLPATAPTISRVAANVALGVPLDMIQGASERERSIAGLLADYGAFKELEGIADSPLKRALFEGIGGGVLSVVGDVPTILRGMKGANQARFISVSAEEFDKSLKVFAHDKPDYQGFITWRSPDEMREEGMKMFLTPDGKAGYALAPDGDIRNLFSIDAPGGTGATAVAHAVNKGGTKLDAFDTRLTDIYKDMGFTETWRMQWDDAYRPHGWNEAMFAKPDVVGMELPNRLRDLESEELISLYNARRARRGKSPITTSRRTVRQAMVDLWGDERGAVGDLERLDDMRAVRNHLTPDEVAWADSRRANLRRVAEVFDELPIVEDFAAAAEAGVVKKGWYRNSANALGVAFGPDAPRFAGVLAALSPQTSVEMNMENALRVWNGWVRGGRQTDKQSIVDLVKTNISAKSEDMTAWVNNLGRALSADDPVQSYLSGPKVNSFFRNLMQDTNEVTLDTWMAKFVGLDQTFLRGRFTGSDEWGTISGKSAKYMGYAAKVRETADYLSKITGDAWSPAEVQETVWSWAKALEEDAGYDIAKVSEASLREVPDFSTLLGEDRYRRLLEEGGLQIPSPATTAPFGTQPPRNAQVNTRLQHAADRMQNRTP